MLKVNPEERLSITELVNQLQEIAAARNVNPKSPITEVGLPGIASRARPRGPTCGMADAALGVLMPPMLGEALHTTHPPRVTDLGSPGGGIS